MQIESELPLLEWMTEPFFASVLAAACRSSSHKTEPILRRVQVAAGTKQGENFAAAIYRCRLDFEHDYLMQHKSLIVKTNSANELISHMIATLGADRSETYFYSRVMEAIGAGDSEAVKFAPSLIYSDENALVMEDLAEAGYTLADRKRQLNLNQAKVVLRKLARFHAATAVLNRTHPDLLRPYTVGTFDSPEVTPLHFFFQASAMECLNTVQANADLEKFAAKYAAFAEQIVEHERSVLSQSDDPEAFVVLNHGDMWPNNIFFKRDAAGLVSDALFVDYQECYLGSVGIDLNHFLYSACDSVVHSHHIPDLLRCYHDSLTKQLAALNYDKTPPTLQHISDEVQRKAIEGLITISTVVPLLLLENPEDADPANFISDTEEAERVRRRVYGNERFVEILKFMLPRFERDGIL